MGDWFKTGWEASSEVEKETESDSGSGGGGYQPVRFWMPAETTKRIMFLDDELFQFYEHSVKINGNWRNYFICRLKNKIDQSCALCDLDTGKDSPINRYYIGFLTIADFSRWESNKGKVYQYDRKLYGVKLGSQKRPGPMKKIKRLRERHGGLTGCVFDVYREGTQSSTVGDEFSLVEKVEPKDIPEYARKMGVNPEPWHQKDNPDGKDWTPFKYAEIFKPQSNDDIRAALGVGGGQQNQGQGNQSGQSKQQTVGGGGGGAGWSDTGGQKGQGHTDKSAFGGDDDAEY